ncbi:MAG: hypothetical protein QOD45_495 [Pseudonocardiales bacterium]|nr:hypothetical protein [Pseudonocardiales bacterium]
MLALAVAGPAFAGSRAAASPVAAQSAGTPGYCHDDTGVTVVVDMSALGGDVVVRCDPTAISTGDSGIGALEGAGFTPTGTQRYGLAFVCRIQGRPAASEALPIPGDPTYHEQCVDTPPATAFWSYWYAPDNGHWTYSTAGANAHQPIEGGFEGWAFSIGSGNASAAAPGVDPSRPGSSQPPTSAGPPPPTTPPTTPPPTSDPGHHHGGGSHSTGPTSTPRTTEAPALSDQPSTAAPPTTHGSAPTTSVQPSRLHQPARRHPSNRDSSGPQQSTPAPSSSVATTAATSHGDVQVTGDLPNDPSGSASSSRSTLVGLGVLVLLGVGAGLTAWRRSHRS